jgi:selenocysteine lyase/cysteine desulfurase
MSFYVENALDVDAKLREKNINSVRKDIIRIAPHFYNTKDKIKYALNELALIVNGE